MARPPAAAPAVLALAIVLGGAPAPAGEEQPAAEAKLDLAALPANVWVPVSAARKPLQPCSDARYLRATDEFVMWGNPAGAKAGGRPYDVQALSLRGPAPEWRDCLPIGRERTWADGRSPGWGLAKYKPKGLPADFWSEDAKDTVVGTFGSINKVKFIETDGVLRPTRVPTFHQCAYDSKRDRLVYYAGGQTFAYDPKARTWTDLKARPLACDALVWASMAYDPAGDRIVLFGGGMGHNPWGGARTWAFDCGKNEWRRPEMKDGVEPPLRCNAQLVYDSKNRRMVLFGGDAQDRFLADTWVLDPAAMSWEERKPEKSPPPLDRYAACFAARHGLVFLAAATGHTGEAGRPGLPQPRSSSGKGIPGCAWTYDVAANAWTPLKGRLPDTGMEWVTCDYSEKDDVVVLAAPGVGTWLYRLDPATATDADPKRESVPPGTWVWNSRGRQQVESILAAPPPDRAATEKQLKELPVNTAVVAEYPGHLISKTWSGATIDTDRGVVIYTGGGHAGYTGNDIALYEVGANRWSFDAPPSFMPLLYNFNKTLAGWDYRRRPQSQHTYNWYCYDPVSKTMVYCPREAGLSHVLTVQLEDDPAKAFTYEPAKHGNWTLVCDPAKNKQYPLMPGRPFGTPYTLNLVGTPHGIYAKPGKELYHGTVRIDGDRADVEWKLLDKDCPATGYSEVQPMVYDSKRSRLVYLLANNGDRDIGAAYERPVPDGAWRKLETKGGPVTPTREVAYDAVNDCLVALCPGSLAVMDCVSNTWRTLDVEMPKGLYGTACALEYDPVHKLLVALIPSGHSARMQVALFRYDPKTAKYRAGGAVQDPADAPAGGEADGD